MAEEAVDLTDDGDVDAARRRARATSRTILALR